MSRWKKGCLAIVILLIAGAFIGVHSRFGKMIAGFTLTPRLEAALEQQLDATVAIGGIDYRLWLAELTLVGVEAESDDGSWRFSLPLARLRFTPLGNVRVLATAPKITLRGDVFGVAARPDDLSRIEVHDGTVRALTSEGFVPRASRVDVELSGELGVASGIDDVTGERFAKKVAWDASGFRVD